MDTLMRRILLILGLMFCGAFASFSGGSAVNGQSLFPTGTVVRLAGTPHLWIAGPDGRLHWLSDSRAAAQLPIDWSRQTEVSLPELARLPIGDPLLSACLVRIGDAIYLVQWDSAEAQPRLLQVRSLADLALVGITERNFSQFLLGRAEWEQRFGLGVSNLARAEFAPPGATGSSCRSADSTPQPAERSYPPDTTRYTRPPVPEDYTPRVVVPPPTPTPPSTPPARECTPE
jgi:hypothetical protein